MCFRDLGKWWIVLTIIFLFHPHFTDGACSFPMNSGTWWSTDKGSLTVTSTTISNYATTSFGTISLECETNSGNYYVARSAIFSLNNVDVRAYMCFYITRVNSYQYYYYLGAEEEASLSNERMKTVATSATVGVSDICDRTVYPSGLYYILVQDGYTEQAASTCSSELQADWSYTFTDSSGNTACSSGSELIVCSETTTLFFNYTACAQNVMYSTGGELFCLYSSTRGSMTYQHVYNKDSSTDESTTYKISCLVISSEDDTRYLTQYPSNCYDLQTSKAVNSPGATLVFTKTSSCPYTPYVPEKSYTAAIALGVVVPLILIIIIIIIARLAYKHYQENKKVETPKPDPKYANGEIRNKRLCITNDVQKDEKTPISNGVRIDEKPTIFDTPRSVEINIDERLIRPESSTVSEDMSIGIRRESSILLDINPSTRGTMVAESLPEMSEKDEYSSEYTETDVTDNEDDQKQLNENNAEFLNDKIDEGTQTPNIPQIVIDSVEGRGQSQDTVPDLVPSTSTTTHDQQTSVTPNQQSEGTQANIKKKRKRLRRKKSASGSRKIKSASRQRSESMMKGLIRPKQKPDCYGNTDDRLVFGTRINILRIRPKSFRKKKQVEPLLEDTDSPIDPSLNDLDRPGSSKISYNTPTPERVETRGDREEVDVENDYKVVPDETQSANASKSNLKRNETRLREKIYRVTSRDLSSSKRRKKQPKLLHPLERKKGGTPEPVAESWFKHKSASSHSRNSFTNKGDNTDDGQVSPEVDEHGNLLPPSDGDSPDPIRPPTQQKPFMNPKVETTEEVFEKIKSMWHFGNKWLGNTYIGQNSPKQ